MADEEISCLLSSFDHIYQDYKSGIEEREMLKSNLEIQVKRREALELTCNTLKQENERVWKLYTESLSNLGDELDRRTKCQSLTDQLNTLTNQSLLEQHEYRNAIQSLNNDYQKNIGDKEEQIRGLLLEKATNEGTISLLYEDLSAHKTRAQGLAIELERLKSETESKFQLEIQDLRDCLSTEQEEKNELNKIIRDAQKELLIIRTKLVEQQRNLTSSQHIDTLKSKIMSLRKENEALKRKLSGSQED